MSKERKFLRKDGNPSVKCKEYYQQIRQYALQNNFNNTLNSLELAIDLHSGQFRDGGEPYVVHVMETMLYLMMLGLIEPIYSLYHSLYNTDDVLKKVYEQMDILFSGALLHDSVEDQKSKFKYFKERINEISPIIWRDVNILTKDKDDPYFSTDNYFCGILKIWRTFLIKMADRVCNYSTVDAFNANRMSKYVKEVYTYFYKMSKDGQNNFPEFSRHIKIMDSFLVAISETVASLQGLEGIIQKPNPERLIYYIDGFTEGRNMVNTKKALTCAQKIYLGHKRKSGDDFIIHPLRVCNTLMILNIIDDELCAAALVHEAIKKCKMPENAIELVTKWNLSPKVRDLVTIMASNRYLSLDTYYRLLEEIPKAFVLKMANRVNTCTNLLDLSNVEKQEYINECNDFMYPKIPNVMKKAPEYHYALRLMMFHIKAECNVTQNILSKSSQ